MIYNTPMIQIICGEDTVAARKQISDLKGKYKKQNYLVQDIVPTQLADIQKIGERSAGLFEEKRVFFVRNLQAYLAKSRKWSGTVKELAADDSIEIIDWEEGKSAYELGLKDKSVFKEFKPSASVFQLLDLCSPGNKKPFLKCLTTLAETQDMMFVFILLSRHARALLLAKQSAFPGRIAPWQKTKLISQSKLWKEEQLVNFYEGLAKIDQAMKTSGTPLNLRQSMEVLAAYLL